MNEEQAGPGPV